MWMSAQQNYAKFDSRIMEDSIEQSMNIWWWYDYDSGSSIFSNIKYMIWDIIDGIIHLAIIVSVILLVLYFVYFIVSLFTKWWQKTIEELNTIIQWILKKIQFCFNAWWNFIKNIFGRIRWHKKISVAIIIGLLFINFLNGVVHNQSKLIKVVKIQNWFVWVDLRNETVMNPWYHVYFPYKSDFFLSKTSVFGFEIVAATASTKEDMFVELDYKVWFTMQREWLVDFYTKYGAKSSRDVASNIVMPRVLEVLKKIIKEYSFKEISSKHNEIKTKMITDANSVLTPLWIVLSDINVLDIRLPESYIRSIEDLEKAENELKLAEAELTKQKKEAEKAELEAQTSKKVQIIEAEWIAEYNRILRQNPPSEEMLELKKIEIEKLKVEKWDGSLSENSEKYIPAPSTNNVKKAFVREKE